MIYSGFDSSGYKAGMSILHFAWRFRRRTGDFCAGGSAVLKGRDASPWWDHKYGPGFLGLEGEAGRWAKGRA